LIPCLI